MSFADDVRDAPFAKYLPLNALRVWQQAQPCNRQLVIAGLTGATGVVLRERRDGSWFAADYSSATTAALALSGPLRWRRTDPPPLAPRRKQKPAPKGKPCRR